MEEQVPEERPEDETLENKVEPAEEPQAPQADSTRAEAPESPEVMMPIDQVPAALPVEPMSVETAEPAEAEAAEQAAAEAAAEPEATPRQAEAVEEPVGETSAAAVEQPRPTPSTPSGLRGGRMPLLEAAPEASSEPAWYVVHCYSGYENKVRHNLEQRIETMGMKDRIFDVVIPTQEEIEVRDGKRRTVERHIFPGYVLVNMSLSEESWYVVRNTPGVTGFVGMGNLPTALRPEEVAQIIKRMEAEAPTVKVSFKVGERVRIIDGPFNDFRGTVADIDLERTKVRVMVSFFGRETPVELDFLQVEKA